MASEELPEKVVGDLELGEDHWQVTHGPENLAHHPDNQLNKYSAKNHNEKLDFELKKKE